VSASEGKPDILTLLTTWPVCFDSTVPLYLSELGQAATLAGAFRDRALIPGAVYREIDGLSRDEFPAARTLLYPRPFARVVQLSGEELDNVLERQRRWNGDRVYDDPSEDRGEAECLQLCMRYPDHSLALCAHDHKARNDPDGRGVVKLHAVHICLLFAVRGVSTAASWRLYTDLIRRGMSEVKDLPPNRAGERLFTQVVDRARRRLAQIRAAR